MDELISRIVSTPREGGKVTENSKGEGAE